MCEIAQLAAFKERLESFLQQWAQPLDQQCRNHADIQVKAAYCIWARYTMSIRTVVHLSEPQFIPDLFVIARCCVEFNASLNAVLNDVNVAEQYLDFEKSALCSYVKYLEENDRTDDAENAREILKQMGVTDPTKHKSKKWCKQGYTKLVQKHAPNAVNLYGQLSDFVHGSVVALRFMERQRPTEDGPGRIQMITDLGYVSSTKTFLDRAWGVIITDESERCKNDFLGVAMCLS
jgi:hypothetical protein